MGIRNLISNIFGSSSTGRAKDEASGQQARDRLTVVLMHDRADISPGMMDNMKRDIIEVIKKYVDIDEAEIDLALKNEDDSVALMANIPIKTVLRRRGRSGR